MSAQPKPDGSSAEIARDMLNDVGDINGPADVAEYLASHPAADDALVSFIRKLQDACPDLRPPLGDEQCSS